MSNRIGFHLNVLANGTNHGNYYFFECWNCHVITGIPARVETVARERAGDVPIFCANGHKGFFSKGESEEDKLRKERDRLAQRVAEWSDAYEEQRKRAELAERQRSAAKGQVTKIKKRVHAGVCPCCNRTFVDLARHMAGKHPGYISVPTADAHVN